MILTPFNLIAVQKELRNHKLYVHKVKFENVEYGPRIQYRTFLIISQQLKVCCEGVVA